MTSLQSVHPAYVIDQCTSDILVNACHCGTQKELFTHAWFVTSAHSDRKGVDMCVRARVRVCVCASVSVCAYMSVGLSVHAEFLINYILKLSENTHTHSLSLSLSLSLSICLSVYLSIFPSVWQLVSSSFHFQPFIPVYVRVSVCAWGYRCMCAWVNY